MVTSTHKKFEFCQDKFIYALFLVLRNLQNRFESQLLVNLRVDTFSENATFIVCSEPFSEKCDLYLLSMAR